MIYKYYNFFSDFQNNLSNEPKIKESPAGDLKVLERKNQLKSIETLKSQLDILQNRLISGML